MPHALAADRVRLYYEEAGSGTPVIFAHEFAADFASWEPQLRYFSRRHRCIAYSARGYLPSDVPAAAESYSYQHFRADLVAVLDHLQIARAHVVGLSMGAYTTLQVGLHHPGRALSLTLAGVGSGSERWYTEQFRVHSRAVADAFETQGAEAFAKVYGMGAGRIPFLVKDPRGFEEFLAALGRHDGRGSAHTQRNFQAGRPSLYDFEADIRRIALPALIVVGDEDDACIEPSLFLKKHIPASGLAVFPKTGHVVNLEEPALFNETLERFLALAEAGRWPPRDPRSIRPGP